jgi:ribose/xylose/arabinose/galactoside ABC-type transport system permease subunit
MNQYTDRTKNKKILNFIVSIAPVVWIIVAMIVVLASIAPGFFTYNNLLNILRNASPLLIAGIGQTMIMLTEGIDLSVSYLIGLCTITTAFLLSISLPLAICGGIFMGVFLGFINGFLIAKWKLPAFISTLGMGQVCFGTGLLITGGLTIGALDRTFRKIGTGILLGVPVPVVITIAVFGIAWVIMNKTTYGRDVYGLGGNRKSLYLCGVNLITKEIKVYMFAGMLYGIASVMLTARNASGNINMAVGWEFQTLAAVLIGGTSFNEGRGSINKTILGVVLVTILRNGLNVAGVKNAYQYLLIGVVVLSAIIIDVSVRERRLKAVI